MSPEATDTAVDVDDEPLLTIEVWQLAVLVGAFAYLVAHFVAGAPLPVDGSYLKFKLAKEALGLVGGLALLGLLAFARRGRDYDFDD